MEYLFTQQLGVLLEKIWVLFIVLATEIEISYDGRVLQIKQSPKVAVASTRLILHMQETTPAKYGQPHFLQVNTTSLLLFNCQCALCLIHQPL